MDTFESLNHSVWECKDHVVSGHPGWIRIASVC